MTFKPLLSVFAAGVFVGQAALCRAADSGNATAYSALRTMAKSLGADTINHVVEVTGRGGAPQPATWRIVVVGGSKGAREVKVTGSQVVSHPASGETASLQTIRLTELNLDSSGAFEAADKEARRAKVPFTSLNYSLRVNPTTGKPVWDLELYNDARVRVGGVRLAAHDGNLLAVNGLTPGQSAPTPRPPGLVSSGSDHDSVRPTQVRPSRNGSTTTTTTTYNTVQTRPAPSDDEDDRRDSSRSTGEGGFFSRVGRTLDRTTDRVNDSVGRAGDSVGRAGDSVGRTVRRTGVKLQRFFSGRSDSDQNNSSD